MTRMFINCNEISYIKHYPTKTTTYVKKEDNILNRIFKNSKFVYKDIDGNIFDEGKYYDKEIYKIEKNVSNILVKRKLFIKIVMSNGSEFKRSFDTETDFQEFIKHITRINNTITEIKNITT